MSPLPSEELNKAWVSAFTEVRFPAMLIDHECRVVAANPMGERWKSSHDVADRLKELDGPALPLSSGKFMRLNADHGGGGALLGLEDGRTLIAFGTSDCPSVDEYVRLFATLLRVEETLRARNDRLEVYHELLTHDAPNYLTAIYGYLQMIQSTDLPREKLLRYIDTSVKQTEALNHLIDTARTLRQLETTPLGEVEDLDLKELVDAATATVLDALPEKRPEIKDRIPPGPHLVRGEPGLGEVFRIILNNAVRYSDSPRAIIELSDEGDDWHLKFTDNGRGIPDEKKEFVFLRFDRLDKQRKIRGSGLGLALARALVERHNGRIWVENAVPGDHTKGSVFHVVLPKA